MPISGIVISFDCSDVKRDTALEMINLDSRVELGEIDGRKVPGVLETMNQREDRDMLRWLNDLDGVNFVDVVFVNFEEMEGTVNELSM